MTKISYIAGVGATDRRAANGAGIKPQPFIPYLSMTKGEMQLALLLEQSQILGGYYGDKKYLDAETMLQNALYRGLHGATPYLGAYNPELRRLATVIADARRQTAPASGQILGRQSMVSGVHVGEVIIPFDDRLKACLDSANKLPATQRAAAQAKCLRAAKIEKILNDGLENCGQYLAYGFLPKNNNLPQTANLKIYNQELAQQDISRVGKFDMALTQGWLNTGMMRRNVDTANTKPYDWINTNAILTLLPEAGQQEMILMLQKTRSGAEAGNKLAAIVKKYQTEQIGDPVTIALSIIGAVTALIGKITDFGKLIKAEQNDAFNQVNGFGARALGPENGDWDGDGIPNEQDSTPKGDTGSSYNVPLLIGAGLAALLLLK